MKRIIKKRGKNSEKVVYNEFHKNLWSSLLLYWDWLLRCPVHVQCNILVNNALIELVHARLN